MTSSCRLLVQVAIRALGTQCTAAPPALQPWADEISAGAGGAPAGNISGHRHHCVHLLPCARALMPISGCKCHDVQSSLGEMKRAALKLRAQTRREPDMEVFPQEKSSQNDKRNRHQDRMDRALGTRGPSFKLRWFPIGT